METHARQVCGLALLALGTALPTAAQTVVGTVIDEGTGLPVPGAFVVLESEAGERRASALAGDDGRFVLRAGTGGRFRLLAELIGYASERSAPFEVGPEATVERTASIRVRALSLDGIRVESTSRCRAGPGSGPATARLWEEARKALEVVRWSDAQDLLRLHVTRHRRVLDANTLQMTDAAESRTQGIYRASPFQSLPADSLAKAGYVQRDADDALNFYAPDADVLLSESFLDLHCFRVVEDASEPDLIGLGFEPTAATGVPDVGGVLWLARGTAELSHLEFRYLRTPFPDHWSHLGGRVDFSRLATGIWVVERWHIRMPHRARPEGGVAGSPRSTVLVTVAEEGGVLDRVETLSGEVLARATGATLIGVATRAGGTEALREATLELYPLGRSVSTGPDGTFRVAGLPEGRIAVVLRHPDLDLLGLPPVEASVNLAPGAARRLELDAGLTAESASHLCRERLGPEAADTASRASVVFGVVRAPGRDAPEPGAVVHYDFGSGSRRALADSAGVYRLCAPAGAAIRIAATTPVGLRTDLDALGPTRMEAAPGGFTRLDLELSRTSPGIVADRRRGWSNALFGAVMDEATRRPLASAAVRMRDASGAPIVETLTDGEGRFVIPHPGRGGSYTLEVEGLGYAGVTGDVSFDEGEEVRVDVLLSARAFELDPLVVTARRRGMLVDAGFYERSDRGFGHFIDRTEIERRIPARTTDLFRNVPGYRVLPLGPFNSDVRLTTVTTLQGMNDSCQPKVILDGVVARAGGRMKQGAAAFANSLDNIVNPAEIEGMEVYGHASQVPAVYGGIDATCGVIVIWTRRGG
ncbi:MAG: carboxypeptidase regulatory-like domain-containing protein [Longimicrobiales bacterium]|nr:carboxypeptidase regulatory-like domain-containing protein [Longimicrobiales bacterium]